MKKLLPPALFLISLAAMSILHRQWPIAHVGPSWIRVAAWVVAAFGLGLAIAGARHFARLGINIKTFDEPGKLVVDGLFRYSRNPMYLGFAISLLGIAVALGSAAPFIVCAIFVAVTDRWYIAFEERAMATKFGAAYHAYRRRTRRWL